MSFKTFPERSGKNSENGCINTLTKFTREQNLPTHYKALIHAYEQTDNTLREIVIDIPYYAMSRREYARRESWTVDKEESRQEHADTWRYLHMLHEMHAGAQE